MLKKLKYEVIGKYPKSEIRRYDAGEKILQRDEKEYVQGNMFD